MIINQPVLIDLTWIIQLDQNPLTATASIPAQGFRTIDWKNSIIEINFYVPVDAQDYDIKLYDPQKNVYTITSPEYQQNFKSWNGLYNIHTFTVTSVNLFTAHLS